MITQSPKTPQPILDKNRRWAERNPDKIRERNRLNYQKHREERKARQREYNRTHSAEINEKLRAKRAAHPEIHKAANRRYYDKKRRESPEYKDYQKEYRESHKEEIRLQRAAYRASHKQEIRERMLAYYRTEKGKTYFMRMRSRHADSPLLKENKYILLWVENRPCEQCGGYERREVDHIVEQQHGGSDELSNLRVLCFKCHRGAGHGRHSTWRAG